MLYQIREAFVKLAWNLINSTSLWANLAHQKYLEGMHPQLAMTWIGDLTCGKVLLRKYRICVIKLFRSLGEGETCFG